MIKKIINIIITSLLFIIVGCSANQDQSISTVHNTTTTPIVSESQSLAPEPITPSHTPSQSSETSPQTQPANTECPNYTLDNMEIPFHFNMSMEEALKVLSDEGIEYEIQDDISPFRSWSGYYVTTNKSFSLVFDLVEKKLHEIKVLNSFVFNLPIKVWDSYKDMIATLGDVGYEEHPTPYTIATHYCEYEMDGYYIRPIFGNEELPVEDSCISEIVLSKYSMDQYENLFEPATLIFTNNEGEQADFYIGMSVDEVKVQLGELELSYTINNGVMSGFSYDDLPENDLPVGFDFDIYFDRNSRVHTIETFGPGVLTQLGLQDGDVEDKMLELYGDNYINVEFYNDYWHNYSYISRDNYLNISTSTQLDISAPVTVLAITRYTETNLKWNSYIGISN